MAQAVQVNTTAATVIAADSPRYRSVAIRNMGPNPVYVDLDSAATVAGSMPVDANGGYYAFRLPPNTAVSMIAATALQVTPADTRIEIVEDAG